LKKLGIEVARRRLEVVSFVAGFSLLAYELAAARVLAPYIGSSTYVWTGVIGVIIAALSLGFFIGGRLADARHRVSDVAWLLIGAAALVLVSLTAYDEVMRTAVEAFDDRRLQAIMAALTLFAPASVFIGTTSPYLAKLKIASLTATGRSIASLDAFNAIGGITGTFVTGFILFGYIGARETFALVGILLLIASWLLAGRQQLGARVITSTILLLLLLAPVTDRPGVVTVDTPSAHYEVVSGVYEGRAVTGLVTGPSGTQSAVYRDATGGLVFWYTNEMARLALERQPKTILMLGGGAFTIPQYLAERLPASRIDVVEVDQKLQTISVDHFDYRNPANVHLIFDDARAFVNETERRYDLILVDVYGDADIPFTLMTKEYGQAVARLLRPGGLLAANVIAGTTGPCRDVFAAVHGAYGGALTYGQYRRDPRGERDRANNVLIYSDQPLSQAGYETTPFNTTHIYSDNFAPGERLYFACQQG